MIKRKTASLVKKTSNKPVAPKKENPIANDVEKDKSLAAPVLTELEYDLQKIVVKDGQKFYPLYLSNIIGVEGNRNYVIIYQLNRNPIRIKVTLKYMKERLAFPHFIFVHDSFIANVHHFVTFSPTKAGAGILDMVEGVRFLVSSQHKQEVI